ncbi:MAG: iron ABC transporter substrate-binding protein [Oscillospiraceae bacterium]|nr:iron ABC transporter substrate-binding protein [Oscillospiraceae bacterium]
MKKLLSLLLAAVLYLGLFAGCSPKPNDSADKTRTVTDAKGREVKVPEKVESIVCVGVGALRYTCYMGAADLVVAVEDCEKEAVISRLYNFVNIDKFKDLPVIGTNGNPYAEEIIKVSPDVVVMSKSASVEADDLQNKTGTPVVVVPGSDTTLDNDAFETIRIMGELYGREARATELTEYLKNIQKDLDDRTKNIPDSEKPSVYVGGVSFKGHHGFEGTEAGYGPLALIHAKNLADTTGKTGAFNIDLEKVLSWDPDIIFLDFNGMSLINEDYRKNPDYYNSLAAVKNGKVYSQISFRSNASNLETALADAYYAACVIYPEQFRDVDPIAKAGEIFEKLLETNPYDKLKEAGYAFRPIKIGE